MPTNLFKRNVDVDVLEIMYAGTAHFDAGRRESSR